MAKGEVPEGAPGPYVVVTLAESPLMRSIERVEVEDHDRLIDKAVVWVRDLDHQASDFALEGMRFKVELGWGGEHGVVFDGWVRRVEVEATPDGVGRVVKVTAYDPSYRLMVRKPPKAVDHVGKLSAIVKKLVEDAGIPAGKIEPDPDPEFTKDKPLRQVGKTDWQFIQDLTLAHGGRAFVEYNDESSQFYFVSEKKLLGQDPMGTLQICRGISHVKKFKVDRVAAWSAMERVAAGIVDPKTGEPVPIPEAVPAAPGAEPAPDPARASRLAKEMGKGAEARYNAAAQIAAEAPSKPEEQKTAGPALGLPSDPEILAQLSRVDPTRVSGLRAEGLTNGTVMLRAKGKVTVEGLSVWADGDWYVQKAVHTVRGGRYDPEAGVARGATYETAFVATR